MINTPSVNTLAGPNGYTAETDVRLIAGIPLFLRIIERLNLNLN